MLDSTSYSTGIGSVAACSSCYLHHYWTCMSICMSISCNWTYPNESQNPTPNLTNPICGLSSPYRVEAASSPYRSHDFTSVDHDGTPSATYSNRPTVETYTSSDWGTLMHRLVGELEEQKRLEINCAEWAQILLRGAGQDHSTNLTELIRLWATLQARRGVSASKNKVPRQEGGSHYRHCCTVFWR
jgi:hypothetical protein